jgi:cytochrome c
MIKTVATVAILLGASAGTALAGDAAAGELLFKKCFPCHSVGEGAKNKVGPILNGLEGRKTGMVDGYSYSDANKSSGITWNEAAFKEYIRDPKAKIPNTKMAFLGLKTDKEADDVWDYLKQFSADGTKK